MHDPLSPPPHDGIEKLRRHLDRIEASLHPDTGLLREQLQSVSYHSSLPPGTWVQPVRENFKYSVGLLRSERGGDIARACAALKILLPLQDSDPASSTFGVWPYYLEESLAEMSPPDWNWADFCAASIAVILHEQAERLPPDLKTALETALCRAAASIFRRNVGPSYTNISVMGAGICAMAGECAGMPFMLEYARSRMRRFLAHTLDHGGLNEYNSPTYIFVTLHECERILQIVADPAMRAAAENLRHWVWGWIAERYHPATGQIAGPHSRSYDDLLSAGSATYLQTMTGVPIPGARSKPWGGLNEPVQSLPCPAEFTARFRRLPSSPLWIRSRFIRRRPESKSIYGSTWFHENACLGTVNEDCLWTQRRPLLAYIAGPAGTAVLKTQLLRDGKVCASAMLRCAQDGPRVLMAWQFCTNLGDHHLFLDHPPGGIFHAADLRIRVSLEGPGVGMEAADETGATFHAGDWRARFQTAPARFDGQKLSWQPHRREACVALDLSLIQGEARAFCFADLKDSLLSATLELSPLKSASPPPEAIDVQEVDGTARLSWKGLDLTSPLFPETYPLE